MKKTILVFGVISGLISTVMMWIFMPLLNKNVIDYDGGEVFGYTAIILSFLFVYFGIRSYRDQQPGKTITFGKAFKVGILIVLITCTFYSLSWVILNITIMPDFADKYGAKALELAKQTAKTPKELADKMYWMNLYVKWSHNPIANFFITFVVEPFPIGLFVALVSAAILRRKKATGVITSSGAEV